MAVDLYPYSGRQSGRVGDSEHETLWSALGDGVLPLQAATALVLTVSSASRTWTVQPGNCMIRGHVLHSDTAVSGTLAANTGAVRFDAVVAYVDRSSTPWAYGIGVHQGTAGAGNPVLTASSTGRFEVALGLVQVLNTGQATLVPYTYRQNLYPVRGVYDSGWNSIPPNTSTYWQPNGTQTIRRIDRLVFLMGGFTVKTGQPSLAAYTQAQLALTIPSSYCPDLTIRYPVYAAVGVGYVEITSYGNVFYTGNAAIAAGVSVDVSGSWPATPMNNAAPYDNNAF